MQHQKGIQAAHSFCIFFTNLFLKRNIIRKVALDNTPKAVKEGRKEYLISICLFLLVIIIGYFHLINGVDLTDEGMYISSPFRYSLGDIPFQDDVMNLARPFDILIMPIYKLFPNISLLDIRLLGLFLHIISLTILFLFFSRFSSPIVVSLCCIAMFLWSDPYNIISPSYNSISRDLSILSFTMWLFSMILTNKYYAAIFSIFGGIFLGLTSLSYLSQVALIVVPILFVIYYLYFLSPKIYWPCIRLSCIFILAFALTLTAGILMAAQSGFLNGYFSWFQEITNTNDIKILGPLAKLGIIFDEFMNILPRAILLIAIGVIIPLFIVFKRKRVNSFITFSYILFVLVTFLFILLKSSLIILLGFTIPTAAILICLPILEPKIGKWPFVRNISIIWGCLSVIIFSASSGAGLKNGLFGSTIIFLVTIISYFRIVFFKACYTNSQRLFKCAIYGLIVVILSAFTIDGLNHLYGYRYRESGIIQLKARFHHPKLNGIYSTERKVKILENLLRYLEKRIGPKEYLLAYNSIPLLYYLTNTRPALAVTWARDDWPLSTRKRLLSRMLQKQRFPEYCVRMLALPENNWEKAMPYDSQSPWDNYVQNNYYLEKIIYPFEIWHLGKGPKFRVYDNKNIIFKAYFNNIKRFGAINQRELAQRAPPLINLGDRGNFLFSSDFEGGIRIFPLAPNNKDNCEIQFGYSLGENGFDINLAEGQTAVLMLEARLNGKRENFAEIFIQDKVEKWERNSASIYKYAWEQYIISKKIRRGSSKVDFGINWKPKNINTYLEIKNLRIVIEENINVSP